MDYQKFLQDREDAQNKMNIVIEDFLNKYKEIVHVDVELTITPKIIGGYSYNLQIKTRI